VSSYLPLITGSGGALIVLALGFFLWVTGKIHSDGEYQEMKDDRDFWRTSAQDNATARDIERRIATETAQAGQVTNTVLELLADIASERTGRPARARRKPGPLTQEDLGL